MSNNFNIENNKELKQNPFKTPEGYLEGLEQKLQGIAKPEAKVVALKPRSVFRRWYAIAAAFTLLLASTWILNLNSESSIDELNAAEIADLTEEGFVSFSETELLEFVSVEDLDDFWPESEEDDINTYLESTDLQYVDDYYLYEDI